MNEAPIADWIEQIQGAGSPPRSTREVFEDHLRCRLAGELEEDLVRNYDDDVILLTGAGVFQGKEGVRLCAALLQERLACCRYEYRTRLAEGEMAFLEWSARCPTVVVEDGADSYLIRGGRIVAQTIHYTVRPIQAKALQLEDGQNVASPVSRE